MTSDQNPCEGVTDDLVARFCPDYAKLMQIFLPTLTSWAESTHEESAVVEIIYDLACLLLGSGAVSYFLIWLRHKTRANVVFLSLWHGLSASTVSWKQLLDEETFIIHDQLEMLVKMFDPSKCWSKSNGVHLQDGLRTVNNNDWSRIMMHPVLCDIIIVISIVSLHHYISLCTREIIINEIFAKQWVVEFEEMISDEYCC